MADLELGGGGSGEAPLVVVGGGLAGCEAAWQAARRGIGVLLYEMRPVRSSPAHVSDRLAELVCSNSLRSNELGNAVGLLKEEMRRLGSLVLEAADATAVPAGRALAVDREAFGEHIGRRIDAHPRIQLVREVVAKIPDAPQVILATGPLTAPELARDVQEALGEEYLYFYDAIAPTVYGDGIDPDVAFHASRYEDGEGDYLNLPLDRAAYLAFVDALRVAETVPLHAFEAAIYFEGCLPIEELARRGVDTPAYGPMKPVGLVDPRTGRRPHAVVQLRREDRDGTLYSLVGFQTKLRIGEQRRIFRSLPGLSKAVFARYGSVHRNTYVNAPRGLCETLELRSRRGVRIAGQLAGVEGYVESAALGLLAGICATAALRGERALLPPRETAHGALLSYLSGSGSGSDRVSGSGSPRDRFQPSNINYGLFPRLADLPRRIPKRDKNRLLAERALAALGPFAEAVAPR